MIRILNSNCFFLADLFYLFWLLNSLNSIPSATSYLTSTYLLSLLSHIYALPLRSYLTCTTSSSIPTSFPYCFLAFNLYTLSSLLSVSMLSTRAPLHSLLVSSLSMTQLELIKEEITSLFFFIYLPKKIHLKDVECHKESALRSAHTHTHSSGRE